MRENGIVAGGEGTHALCEGRVVEVSNLKGEAAGKGPCESQAATPPRLQDALDTRENAIGWNCEIQFVSGIAHTHQSQPKTAREMPAKLVDAQAISSNWGIWKAWREHQQFRQHKASAKGGLPTPD